MACQKCSSERIANVYGKCSDLCVVTIVAGDDVAEHEGYVPGDMNIGGGDDINFEVCLECGQLQGEWPLAPTKLELESQ